MAKPQTPNRKDIKKLDEIGELISYRRYDEAYQQLLDLTKKRSRLGEAWDMLIEVASQLDQIYTIWQACEVMHDLEPDEHSYVVNLVYTSGQLGFPFMTKYYVDICLERFPNSSETSKIKKLNEEIIKDLPTLKADLHVPEDASLDDLYIHEKAQLLITHGNITEGRRLAQKATRKLPQMAAPRNNLSLSYTVSGDFDKALKIVDETLNDFPDNLFAQCSKIQFLTRLGRQDDVADLIQTLRTQETNNPEYWLKMTETIALLSADEWVKEKYEQAIANIQKNKDPVPPLLYHYGATAYARLGDEKKARSLWQKAIALDRQLHLAQYNLDDLRLPANKRVGAWYSNIQTLIPQAWLERLARGAERTAKKGIQSYKKDVERVFRTFAGFRETLALILKIGDANAIDFVLNVADIYPLPELIDFMQGKHGTDMQRMKAGNLAVEHGLYDPQQPVTMIQNGEETQVMLLNFEIHEEVGPWDGDPQAQDLYEQAYNDMHKGKYKAALATINKALEIEPDKRELFNAKHNTLLALKRTAEAEALLNELLEKHPDYFFANVDKARMLIRQDKLDEALEILNSFTTKTRFHFSEFKAFVVAQVEYATAIKQPKGAVRWVQMLHSVDPDAVPDAYKPLVELADLL